jgi:hypothetical protein
MISPELNGFVEMMGFKLASNQSKGGWKGLTANEALKRIEEQTAKLKGVVKDRSASTYEIMSICANVANYAMICGDVYIPKKKKG